MKTFKTYYQFNNVRLMNKSYQELLCMINKYQLLATIQKQVLGKVSTRKKRRQKLCGIFHVCGTSQAQASELGPSPKSIKYSWCCIIPGQGGSPNDYFMPFITLLDPNGDILKCFLAEQLSHPLSGPGHRADTLGWTKIVKSVFTFLNVSDQKEHILFCPKK